MGEPVSGEQRLVEQDDCHPVQETLSEGDPGTSVDEEGDQVRTTTTDQHQGSFELLLGWCPQQDRLELGGSSDRS